jgi:Flp pilus assembly pilin Flp
MFKMKHPWIAKRLGSWKCFAARFHGQDVIEYSLLLAFVALGAIAILIGASQPVGSIWNRADSHLKKGHHYAEGHEK